MSFVVKAILALALATAALWTATTAPITAPPDAPAPWSDGAVLARRVVDTLSVDAALGQLIATRSDVAGLGELVAAGAVGRVQVPGGGADAHLDRLRQWQAAAPLPVLISTSAGDDLSLPFPEAPALPSAAAMGATGRADLAYLAGRSLAEVATGLGVQAPGLPLTLGPGGSAFGRDGDGIEQALARGVRDGGALPVARITADVDVAQLDALTRAGLMEVRVVIQDDADLGRLRAIQAQSAFSGLVQAEVDGQARGAVDALRAGADVILSDAPRVVLDSLRRAVASGRLTEARLRDSAVRVLSAKAWAGLALAPPIRGRGDQRPAQRLDAWRPPTAAVSHRADLVLDASARAAATVLQDEDGPLPLVGASVPRSTFVILLDPGLEPDAGLVLANTVALNLAPEGRTSYMRLGLGMPGERYDDALDAARDADLVIVAALPDAAESLAPRHRDLAERVAERRTTVVVALGPAALAAGLERSAATVVAYGGDAAAQRAAAHALTGRAEVAGTLPFGVGGLAPAGAGLAFRQQALRLGTPEEVGVDARAVDRVDAVMERAVRDGAFPGAAVAVGRDGVLLRLQGYGRLSRTGDPVTPDTPYDLASLTKVVGTTATAMRLVERGDLDLDAAVVRYLPRYRSLGKDAVTVRQLLEHSAGHRAWYPFWSHGILDRRATLDFIYADTLQYPPGTRSRYSDFDMILLGEVLEEVSGASLDELFRDEVFAPLGMTHTGFRRAGAVDRAVAPTEHDRAFRGRMLQGEVHDEAASVMGGIAGHAGLFSTAGDLARFAYTLADGGSGYGARLVRRTTLDQFTRPVRLRSTYPTGLGWMVNAGAGNSAAGGMSARTFGHTGYTGTSIWIDPDQRSFVVLLSNRVHPSRTNSRIREVRPALADALADAIRTPPGQAPASWGFGPLPDDLPSVR